MSVCRKATAVFYSCRRKVAGEEGKEQQDGPPWVIIAFTVNLVIGLIASQVTATSFEHQAYHIWAECVKLVTMICLSFIMVNVGYEFVLDKSNMGQYGKDFLIAMSAAGLPALFVALWFMFVLPDPLSWKLALISGLFAAPTSAGILFSMLEAAGLKETWVFRKARVLAVFDDLGTLLLLVPLKVCISGFKWELSIEVGLVLLMLFVAFWKLHAIPIPSSWRWTGIYAVVITALCKLVHYITDEHIAMEAIEVEVLLPAFTLGCITRVSHGEEEGHQDDVEEGSGTMQSAHAEEEAEEKIKTGISMVFMLLVGLAMPSLFGGSHHGGHGGGAHAHGEDHGGHSAEHGDDHGELGPAMTLVHVLAVTVLMTLGKMLPTVCYKKEADLKTRFALSLGMCPRGEVGAGVIVISLGLGMQGSSVRVAVLSLAVNLVLSSAFIVMVKRLLKQPAASESREVKDAIFEENETAGSATPDDREATTASKSCKENVTNLDVSEEQVSDEQDPEVSPVTAGGAEGDCMPQVAPQAAEGVMSI